MTPGWINVTASYPDAPLVAAGDKAQWTARDFMAAIPYCSAGPKLLLHLHLCISARKVVYSEQMLID